MNERHPEPWLERALALLDQSTENLDAATLSRLNRARQQALARRRARHPLWLGLGAVGAAAALVLGLGLARHAGGPLSALPAQNPASAAADVAADGLLADEDNAELVEDLDFYAWLATQPGGGQG